MRDVPNPTGLCMCGCGRATLVAKKTGGGYRSGESRRFVMGHQHRSAPALYTIDASSGCWNWLGAIGGTADGNGYGHLRVAGRVVRAHRYMYERLVGPIPRGMELDHLCRNRRCVNPEHLEPVTHAENMRRAAKLADRDVCAARWLMDLGVPRSAIAAALGTTAGYLTHLAARRARRAVSCPAAGGGAAS